jgi:uncharacterized membrane protein
MTSQWSETALLIAAWYATSIVATNTSKALAMDAAVLTMCQLVMASGCSFLLLRILKLRPYRPMNSTEEVRTTSFLAFAFMLGFVSLNAALRSMHVSLVMTLRATEPLFTLGLSTLILGSDNALQRLVALLPVVVGASMFALGSTETTVVGAAMCALSNSCFAGRGVLTKVIKTKHGADDYSLFLHINVVGALMAGVFVLMSGSVVQLPSSTTMLALNGVASWAYLQLSWLVLARVTAVTHSVCNAMRRPAVILAGWLQFGNEISYLNGCGIALACGGAALYGHVSRSPPPPAEERETLV